MRNTLNQKLQKKAFIYLFILKYNILGVEPQLSIHPLEEATASQETHLSSGIQAMKLHQAAESEGYETMTPDSSDVVSEVKQILY